MVRHGRGHRHHRHPRPVYYADGRKEPDCYTRPPALHDELTEKFGTFPLFHFWGPGADLVSSRWIIDATRHVMSTRHPDLTLCYLPHLDYDLQRYGPDDPRSLKAAADLDTALAPLLDDARAEGRTVVALSEYGITRVNRPVDINRALRRAYLLEVHTQDGMEYLDPMASRAFAVADHQIAHVYVRRPEDLDATREALDGLPGIEQLLDDEGKKAHHLDHPRAGELVAVAEPDAWFTYYYWLDDDRAPDFAQLVEIHRKPGYDPVELFMDPTTPTSRSRRPARWPARSSACATAWRSCPSTPHLFAAATAASPRATTTVRSSSAPPRAVGDRVAATDVKQLLLRLAGLG